MMFTIKDAKTFNPKSKKHIDNIENPL